MVNTQKSCNSVFESVFESGLKLIINARSFIMVSSLGSIIDFCFLLMTKSVRGIKKIMHRFLNFFFFGRCSHLSTYIFIKAET